VSSFVSQSAASGPSLWLQRQEFWTRQPFVTWIPSERRFAIYKDSKPPAGGAPTSTHQATNSILPRRTRLALRDPPAIIHQLLHRPTTSTSTMRFFTVALAGLSLFSGAVSAAPTEKTSGEDIPAPKKGFFPQSAYNNKVYGKLNVIRDGKKDGCFAAWGSWTRDEDACGQYIVRWNAPKDSTYLRTPRLPLRSC
jgi:hypothetical protein